MNIGPVTLTLPAHPAMARVARLTAGAVAAAADTSIDDLDDVKILVSEVMVALTDHGSGDEVRLCFEIADDVARIEGSTPAPVDLDIEAPDLELCRTVLRAIAHDHDVVERDGRLVVTVEKRLDVGTAEG